MNNALVHIVGAGISGMGCAHFLKKNSLHSLIYEQSSQSGGRAGYIKNGDGFFETGGKNFSSSWPNFMDILNTLKINQYDPQPKSFHLMLNGELKKFEKKMGTKEIFHMIKNVGVIGSIQFKKIISYKKRNITKLNYDGGGLIADLEQKFDHSPLTDHFSEKLCKGPLRMFSIIMGGAEPEETYYSNLMKLLPFGGGSLFALTKGIGHLFESLSKIHNVSYHSQVKKILIKNSTVVGLLVNINQQQKMIKCKQVICAVPLHHLPKLMEIPTEVMQVIDAIRYYPVALINAEYQQDVFDQQCQSIMFDKNYHLGHCSANRYYKLNSVRFTIAGKKGREVMHLPDEALINLAEKEFSSVRPIQSSRLRYHVEKHLGGMCAYGPRHTQAKKIICDYISGIKGLEIAGDYLEGHNMGECLISAKKASDNIINGKNNEFVR